jgi:DNA-binding transcriptional LysR family regulator
MFETDALMLLDIVARTGSFTAAAIQLSYTQSAVSRRIASLEAEAGGPLFERLPRGVRLTPAGRVLHRHAREVLERLRRASEDVSAVHEGTGGRLRIGAVASANAALVPTALRAFHQAFPQMAVTLMEGLSGALIDALGRTEIDIAVVSDSPSGLGPGEDAEVVPLLEDELLVALPADHPLAASAMVDLRDLRDESWVEGEQHGGATVLATVCARAGFTPRVDIRVAGWTSKLGYVAAGLGVTLVPAMAASAVRTDLVFRSLGDLAPRRTVYAALPAAAPLPSARTLVDLLKESSMKVDLPV